MALFLLSDDPRFPSADLAEGNGLLAVGGDLTPRRLLAAYRGGIFPWFSEGDPLLWWSPDPRLVLKPEWLHIPRSLAKTIRRKTFAITFDHAFGEVITACAKIRRSGESGTWITREMIDAYLALHRLGHAHSVEAWTGTGASRTLAGGLYGIVQGGCFFGESMFHRVPDASKVAFVTLVHHLAAQGFTLIDCQMTTDHLLRFGAREIARALFLKMLRETRHDSMPPGPWHSFSRP
ncbi:MAG: leucyl/phenylalanyl-tRNA--protein transferase [Magnetococcales bacterium]|nr:leucyl/phenylalanyl-tRNA--protein transferase [Magnetococcales bacterium]